MYVAFANYFILYNLCSLPPKKYICMKLILLKIILSFTVQWHYLKYSNYLWPEKPINFKLFQYIYLSGYDQIEMTDCKLGLWCGSQRAVTSLIFFSFIYIFSKIRFPPLSVRKQWKKKSQLNKCWYLLVKIL